MSAPLTRDAADRARDTVTTLLAEGTDPARVYIFQLATIADEAKAAATTDRGRKRAHAQLRAANVAEATFIALTGETP